MRKIFTILLLSLGMGLLANDISVSNVQLVGQNISAGANNAANYTQVQFDLSWKNSWRSNTGPANWDAAWVFVKYRVGSGDWQHALLNNTGHTAPAGSTIDMGLQTPGSAFNATTNAGIGAFVYRSTNGSGTFSLSNVKLRWNYGANGVQDAAVVDVRVFAIEMVYIPQGSFSVGNSGYGYIWDGSSIAPCGMGTWGQFCAANSNDGSATFTIGATPPTLQGRNPSSSASNLSAAGALGEANFGRGTTTYSLATGFPTGFNAFYGMKYEISQQGYVDFLNTLTRTQQNTRTRTSLASGTTSVTNRYVMSNSTFSGSGFNAIRCDGTINGTAPITFYCDLSGNGTGGESADGQWLACNYLNYMDISAYLDWSGLRPMTELEFEKACRGTLTPVGNEFAWGDSNIDQLKGVSFIGSANERRDSESQYANANYYGTGSVSFNPVVRVGLFASSSGGRRSSGAGYYGMMELSGNVWERAVTVGNATGRAFTGVHGNGELSTNGNANETAWPGLSSGEVSGATGAGFRGGSFGNDPCSGLCTSDRSMADYDGSIPEQFVGGRGVRHAP